MSDMVDKLFITASVFKQIKAHLADSRKIAAIKCLRSATGCGLKEAKYAIERHQSGSKGPGPLICPHYEIIGINLRTPDGEITVDLEGLQLTGLMSLNTMGLDTCRAVLSLHDAITVWRKEQGELFFGDEKIEETEGPDSF